MKKIYKSFFIFCLFIAIHFSPSHLRSQTLGKLDQFNLTDINSDHEGNLYLATEYSGFYISTDEGETWALTNTITTKYNITAILYDDYEGLFLGTMDYACLQSTDHGKTWRRRGAVLKNRINGFELINTMISTKFKYKFFGEDGDYELSFDNYNILSGGYTTINDFIYDNDGTLFGCGTVIIRNKNPDIMNYMYSHWEDVRLPFTSKSYCLALDENNRIYVGTNKGIYYTDNEGDSWTILSDSLKNYSIKSIYTKDNNHIIIGTDTAGMFRSTDGGNSWMKITSSNISSGINKIWAYKDKIFTLTNKKGLYYSIDQGINWTKIDSDLLNTNDSSLVDGWMPSINFYDLFPYKGDIFNVKYLYNDSLLLSMVHEDIDYYYIYDAKTGKFINKFPFNNPIIGFIGNIINLDSVLCTKKNNDSFCEFGLTSMSDTSFVDYFSIPNSYFENKCPGGCWYGGYSISSMNYNSDKTKLYIKYEVTGIIPPQGYDYEYNYIGEIRKISTGELVGNFDYSSVFSFDRNFYLSNNNSLYDKNDILIYNIKDIPENQYYLTNSNVKSACFSQHNKFIVLNDSGNKYFLIIDFLTGKIIRSIKYSDYYDPIFVISFDEQYLFTASNGDILKVYNLSNSNVAFDQVYFWDDYSNWEFSVANTSNTIVFGRSDGILRMWKPDLTLTDVQENNINASDNEEISIYPNPATDFIDVNIMKQTEDLQEINIQIYNLYGKIVREKRVLGDISNLKIDISELIPGLYFLKVGKKILKFVKL